MTINELTRDQLEQVKRHYQTMKADAAGEGISYEELVNADALITDMEIFEAYAGTEFSPDDFT